MINVVKQAALEAGKILLEHFRNIPQDAIRKKAQTDFLSFVDEQSEQCIVETVRASFPKHSILAEEGGAQDNQSDYRWIIDPLDGTTNYLAGLPVFSVSIALQYQGEIVLGVVFDPVHNELFEAELGKGAHCGEIALKVSNKNDLSESLIATGFPFKDKHRLPVYMKAFEDVFKQSVGMRRMGSAAIDLAYLAAGRFDGFWERQLKPWDIAAGSILIKEAGGQMSDFWFSQDFMSGNFILASNGQIHMQLGQILQKHFNH